MKKLLLDTQLHIDERTVNTQNKLYQALLFFYQKKVTFNTLTVTQLCQQAQIGRTTFYRHHQDIIDILTVQQLIIIADFQQRIDDLATLNFQSGSATILSEIQMNPTFFKLIKWSHAQNRIIDVLSGEIIKILNLREEHFENQPILASLLAQNLLNFGATISEYPELTDQQKQNLFNLTIPDLPN